MEKEGVGTFGGQAKLTIEGNSIRDMAAAADGELAVIMGGGQINALIIEALGLDVGEILAVLAAGDEEKEAGMVPVQCFVSRFEVQDGVMMTRALVLETSDSTVTGSGTIDLGQETLDLTLLAHPKDASVLTASTPVAIKGTFRDPQIDVVSEELAEKGLAALALGVVLPVIGAILPFIETGEAEGVNCAALMKAAERRCARKALRAPSPTIRTRTKHLAVHGRSLPREPDHSLSRSRRASSGACWGRLRPAESLRRGRLFSLLSAVAVLDLYGDIGTSPLYGGDTFPAVGAAHTQWVVVGYLSRVSGTWNPITP